MEILSAQTINSDVVQYLTKHPAYASRRYFYDSQDLMTLVGAALVKQGFPAELLADTKWLWVQGPSGPKLYLITAGLRA